MSVEVLSSCRVPILSSINWGSSGTTVWIQVKFGGQVPVCHIPRTVLSFFKILNFQIFTIFFFFFVFISAHVVSNSADNCRGAAIRCPLTQVSQKPLHGSRPNFGEIYLSAISPDLFFQNFLFSNFYDFFFFFVNMGPHGNLNFNTSPTIFIRFQQNFMINMIVMGEYRLLLILAICQKLKILWQIFLNTEPYEAGNFKMLLLQFSFDVSQVLWGHWLAWWNTGYYFFGYRPSFKNFVALWNFNMGGNGK